MLDQVTVVLVTHHSAHCVPDMAQALAEFPHVVVVDNASDDDTPRLVQAQLPHARVLALPRNVGFGSANNQGLAQVHTPYALLLNPDCHIKADAVRQLVATAQAWPQAVIVAPQLWDSEGQPQLNYGWPRWLGASSGEGATGVVAVGYACAAAWLLRVDTTPAWRFDEDFFLYYEDEDLCARLFKARQLVLIDPQARAMHANRGSVRGRSVWLSEWRRGFHHSQSKILFWQRHMGADLARRVRRKALWTGGLEVLLRVFTLHPRLLARSLGRWVGMW